jgi:hypothetical protein
MKKANTLFDRYKTIQKIGTEIEVPYYVWTAFGENQKRMSIMGTDVCLGEDYKSIESVREAIAYYVEQLGGSVEWSE